MTSVLTRTSSLLRALGGIVGAEHAVAGTDSRFLRDGTEARGVSGRADAACLPHTAEEVRQVVAWCYQHDVPVVPRGGGTGFAGGAVPVDGGVVVALERVARVRRFEPLLWRVELEAGVRTGALHRLAHESGLLFPPDPGASEQSQIGGNIATNAGGPHALKYGPTGAWVTGLELVVAPGELVTIGGAVRRDVASYDLKSLVIGSEGTLGVVTAAWLRLVPRPQERAAVVAFYPDTRTGCAAIEAVFGQGIQAAAIEYLDAGTLAAAGRSFPGSIPTGTAFAVIAEVDGSAEDVGCVGPALHDALSANALQLHAATSTGELATLWRWREGVSYAVTARRGGKASEDIAVPLDRLGDAIDSTVEIGRRHGLEACSFGHAGDGIVHSTFLLDLEDASEGERAHAAAADLFALAVTLGGTISGEHGTGKLKQDYLPLQLSPTVLALHRTVKEAFDPKNLLNPGKKGTGI